MTTVTYIWHDGFLVTTAAANFVFDYWLDSDGHNRELPGCVETLPRDAPLYVLVSHGHKDHFNRHIFAWASHFSDIHYIVSNDVMKRVRHVVSETSVYVGPKVRPSAVNALRPGEVFDDGRVRIMAFPSTDIGNSYMAEVAGCRIFHAGDLNAWIWKDESTEKEINKAMGDFRACLREIRKYIDLLPEGADRAIDFAFFPVDSRIGTDYYAGASEFVKEFYVRHFFPMHFSLGDAEEREWRRADALRFDLYANLLRGEYIPLALPGATFMDAGCK